MILSRRIRGLLLIAALTVMVVATVAFDFGRSSAWAAPLSASQTQLAAMGRAEAVSKNLEGKAQELVGNMTGDPKDQIMGQAKQTESQIRNATEDVKDQLQLSGRAKAAAKNIEGNVQEAVGNVTGNTKDQMMGKAKQAESRDRNAIEDLKDGIQNLFD
jgi:uncharacterized protein YjbJ (UPF0337 family)